MAHVLERGRRAGQVLDVISPTAVSAVNGTGGKPPPDLIEPPFQVESHLYQTIQAADWLATWIGRLMARRVDHSSIGIWLKSSPALRLTLIQRMHSLETEGRGAAASRNS